MCSNFSCLFSKANLKAFDIDTINPVAGVPLLYIVVDFPPCINGSKETFSFFIKSPIPFIPYILCITKTRIPPDV